MSEKEIAKVLLSEFNWMWKKHLKGHLTQQQFSRYFRKSCKNYIE